MQDTMDCVTFEVASRWLLRGEMRLNASSFSPDAANAVDLLDALRAKGVPVPTINSMVNDVFYPPRFRRHYSKTGTTFLSSKDIFDLVPEGKKITNASPQYVVRPGCILITRSGSVGRVAISNAAMSEAAVSEHVIRVLPNEDAPVGYIYAFLTSSFGQSLLGKNIFGGVVDEIEPQHVAGIPICRIPELEERVDTMIREVTTLRAAAQRHLAEAKNMLHSSLNLPRIDEDDITYFGSDCGSVVRAFGIKASLLNSRLDASYHAPLVRCAIENLKQARYGTLRRLADVAHSFVPPRFRRAYVKDSSEGLPLLQGTHLSQIKPQGIKYLWKGMKNLRSYIIRKDWICVTCSGTIGRLSLARDGWDGWAATNHILRIVPKASEIHPGYLNVFLLSMYGQAQFQRLVYGGVIDEIGEAGRLFDDILILKPANKEIEERIGNLAYEAYDRRDRANRIEDAAVNLVDSRLRELARKR